LSLLSLQLQLRRVVAVQAMLDWGRTEIRPSPSDCGKEIFVGGAWPQVDEGLASKTRKTAKTIFSAIF
jgi:hypothetical protein